jgi:transcriptional regulator with GAF, ATPase, and Fis domain
MAANERGSDSTTPTGQFEFKLRSVISEQVKQGRRPSLKRLLGLVEKNLIIDVLHSVGGNQRAAGRLLGIKATTLGAKLRRYGIRVIRRIGAGS